MRHRGVRAGVTVETGTPSSIEQGARPAVFRCQPSGMGGKAADERCLGRFGGLAASEKQAGGLACQFLDERVQRGRPGGGRGGIQRLRDRGPGGDLRAGFGRDVARRAGQFGLPRGRAQPDLAGAPPPIPRGRCSMNPWRPSPSPAWCRSARYRLAGRTPAGTPSISNSSSTTRPGSAGSAAQPLIASRSARSSMPVSRGVPASSVGEDVARSDMPQ